MNLNLSQLTPQQIEEIQNDMRQQDAEFDLVEVKESKTYVVRTNPFMTDGEPCLICRHTCRNRNQVHDYCARWQNNPNTRVKWLAVWDRPYKSGNISN